MQNRPLLVNRSPQAYAALAEKLPIIQFLNNLLEDAVQQGVSDLHFEPYENYYRLRVRQDGILHESARLPLKLAPQLTSRLKVMSNLDIAERRLPQDGRFNFKMSELSTKKDRSDFDHIDFRVSSCPTLFGEKMVVRILDPKRRELHIDSLGLEPFQKDIFLEHLSKPQGMILITGPTGSGKTVSLYTAVHVLNTTQRNILSCEDPVEICLPGINQVNINVKAGFNFANALRTFLRQDPDVIMLGEIRDLETAEIAIKAAQTGHLMLSTLHTNSAIETIVRLKNMGIPNFNLAASLSLIVAQRLVRLLCQYCKVPHILPEAILLQLGFLPEELPHISLFGPKGCESCKNGYRGRVGVFELLTIHSGIQTAILNGEHAIELKRKTILEGMWHLKQAGLNKVRQGITSLEEIQRMIMD